MVKKLKMPELNMCNLASYLVVIIIIIILIVLLLKQNKVEKFQELATLVPQPPQIQVTVPQQQQQQQLQQLPDILDSEPLKGETQIYNLFNRNNDSGNNNSNKLLIRVDEDNIEISMENFLVSLLNYENKLYSRKNDIKNTISFHIIKLIENILKLDGDSKKKIDAINHHLIGTHNGEYSDVAHVAYRYLTSLIKSCNNDAAITYCELYKLYKKICNNYILKLEGELFDVLEIELDSSLLDNTLENYIKLHGEDGTTGLCGDKHSIIDLPPTTQVPTTTTTKYIYPCEVKCNEGTYHGKCDNLLGNCGTDISGLCDTLKADKKWTFVPKLI